MHTLCGAPSGVTLSVDEMTAYVFCRSTHGVASVPLLRYDDSDPPAIAAPGTPKPPRVAYRDLAPDPLPEKAALGRRMFFNAADPIMSEGYSCNACHPEGRDDGHVWHQDESLEKDKAGQETIRDTRLHAFALTTTPDADIGVPRQTPMLAGRVSAGPYGWKAHSPSLKHRAIIGFSLHRWSGGWAYDAPKNLDRSEALVAFLRQGLVTPTRHAEPLTPERRARQTAVLRLRCRVCDLSRPEDGVHHARALGAVSAAARQEALRQRKVPQVRIQDPVAGVHRRHRPLLPRRVDPDARAAHRSQR